MVVGSWYGYKNTQNYGYNLTLEFSDFDGYFAWAEAKFSHEHTLHLTNYFKRHLYRKSFDSPLSLYTYISKKQTGIRNITKAVRSYLAYCQESNKLPNELINKYRELIKCKSCKSDYFVPSDDEVIKSYKLIKSNKALKILFLVLATSGIRYVECVRFLQSYDTSKFRVHSNFVSYNVSELRQCKNINNIYLPLFVYKQLTKLSNSYQSMRQKLADKGCLFSPKYLRKWHYNFMLYNNIPESVADFIQGRVNKSVSSNHYLAKSQQASFWYSKVVPLLKRIFSNEETL